MFAREHLSKGACLFFVGLAACGGDDGAEPAADAGVTVDLGTVADSGVIDGGAADLGVDAGARDAGAVDSGLDGGVTDGGDAGQSLPTQIVPGVGADLPQGSIYVGIDTFATTKMKLGTGTRSTESGSRAYEWSLAGGLELTVWFANTNLDSDAGAPNDVDDTDQVLWVSVAGTFTGGTPEGIVLGDSRATVETALGVAPHEIAVSSPTGRLAQYFTSGVLVTYDANDAVRALTACRMYQVEPGGTFLPSQARLELGGSVVIEGYRGGINFGTSQDDITAALGAPDAQGTVSLGSQTLRTWSYGLIGIELFFLGSGSDRLLFSTVHAPYYGTIDGVGLDSPRADVVRELMEDGFTDEKPSSVTGLTCFGASTTSFVGLTSTGTTVTSLSFRLPTCP